MRVTKTTSEQSPSDTPRCKRCNAILPAHATFCGSCGERVEKHTLHSPLSGDKDVTELYRITSLIRRQTYVQLFFALDNQHQRPVVIRDIDISSLDDDARSRAYETAQKEYDLLRRHRVPDVLPLIDLRSFKGHLYTISGWPFQKSAPSATTVQGRTLQDLLQSGIGLPEEQVAITWMYRLCQAVHRLHMHEIVIADLDPHTITVQNDDYSGVPALMISWLPQEIRHLFPSTLASTNATHFTAPEVLLGPAEPRSDVYSLGALLYLLLTGTAPEEASRRAQRPLRPLRDLNSHLSSGLEELVMRSLALESSERFQSTEEMADALLELSSGTRIARPAPRGRQNRHEVIRASASRKRREETEPVDDAEEVTISVVPLQTQLARWQQAQKMAQKQSSQSETTNRLAVKEPPVEESDRQDQQLADSPREELSLQDVETIALSSPSPQRKEESVLTPTHEDEAQTNGLKQWLQGIMPSFSLFNPKANGSLSSLPAHSTVAQNEISFFKLMQRFILGVQQRSTTAAALIETPLRVQPNQSYTIRIHLMGRDEPTPPPGAPLAGLSAMPAGQAVRIEVRSSLYQNYAYIVQRANVQIPRRGYAAEVSIPMRPLAQGPSGRRDRLHIFFMDEDRNPLYEKPFVVEVFISHLVQAGREGHNVLAIPL